MSSLYVDSSKWLLRLGDVRADRSEFIRTPSGRLIRRDLWKANPVLYDKLMEGYVGDYGSPIEPGRGDFGGGGASGELPYPEGAGETTWMPIVVGDPDCPSNGQKPVWKYLVAWNGNEQKTFGPHENGRFRNFWGLNYRPHWNQPDAINHAGWSQEWNYQATGEASHQVFPKGSVPSCGPGMGTGTCQLPPPASAGSNDAWVERYADETTRASYNAEYDNFEVTCGTAWERAVEACEPPHVEYFPVEGSGSSLDRKKVRNAPEEEEEDDALPIPLGFPPPPFVFTTTAGGPSGRPRLRRDYNFRARRPPRSRTRQPPKKKGPIQTIIKIMDVISEASEVVDCVFKALPKAKQKAWEKGRPNRGLLDQAGQFGIDGADWKGQAIWHNSDKVDWVKAFQCVAYNQFIEDAVVGKIAKGLPPGASTAVSRAAAAAEYKLERDRQKAKWARIRAENAARVAAGR